MPKSVNKVTLLGNIGNEPEVKFLPSGQAVSNLSIATSFSVRNKNSDQWEDRTEWHNATAYGRTAEIVREYVRKGSKVYIEGRLTTRSWDDKETQKRLYRTEVVINSLVLLGPKDQSSGPQHESSQQQAATATGEADYYSGTEISDDDIPF